MSSPAPAAPGADETVTGIIVHHPRADARAAYEAWLDEIGAICRRFPGYLSTDVLRPVGSHPTYTIIIRFAGIEALRAWTETPERREALQRIEPALEQGDRYAIRTGLDFWFAPPTVQPPKAWKQYLITLSAIFPLTVVVPWVLGPLLGLLPMLVGKAVVAAVVVALMVYVIMPRYTRRVARWLYG